MQFWIVRMAAYITKFALQPRTLPKLWIKRASEMLYNAYEASLDLTNIESTSAEAGEKKKLDNMADVLDKQLQFENPFLNELQTDLTRIYETRKMDAYLLYLYGLVLNEQNLTDDALKFFVESVNLAPHFWLPWLELSRLIKNKEQYQMLILPDHWMQNLFLGELYQRLQMLNEAVQIYDELMQLNVLRRSLYIKTQLAVVHHNLQGIRIYSRVHFKDPNSVLEIFKDIMDADEYRMDHVDTYSNSLFVRIEHYFKTAKLFSRMSTPF
uniref:Cdc23 domain-containing protein n=1 Tax=Romanomermis culicivorax TaxID=13658 RepID=A0A915IUT6_ROMCU